MLFAPHQKVKITDKTKEDVLSHPEKYTDCDARIRLGKFYTDEEYERYVEESLSRPLPGEEKGPTLVKRRKKLIQISNL